MKSNTTLLCWNVLMSLCEDMWMCMWMHTVFYVFRLASIQIFNETLEQFTEVEDYLAAFFGS